MATKKISNGEEKSVPKKEMKETSRNTKEMSVSEYFDYVKGMKQTTNSEHVKKMADVCATLLEKFQKLGQEDAAKKAKIAFDMLSRDLELYDKGITTYIHLDDVSKYLKTIANHSVKIIEMKNFPREIPDDVVDKYMPVKDLFDEFFIVFTDYTEETEEKDTVAAAQGKKSTTSEVAQKRKEKDPILFGALKVQKDNRSLRGNTYEKLYFIADWVDDYCDLTFDKLVDKMAKELGKDPKTEIVPITTKDEFKKAAKL